MSSGAPGTGGGRVLVTGADGLVGRRVCEKLAAGGRPLRASVRSLKSGAAPPAEDVVATGPVGPDTDWSRALEGVDGVIHLAARVHVLRDPAPDPLAEHRKVNTEGTLNLARQAASAGVRRVVFASTVKVNGETTPGGPFTEDDPPSPRDPYAMSKWEAEQALGRLSAGGPEIVVLRPPLVYGPGVRGNFRRLLRAVDRGVPLPLGRATALRSLLYLDNLVHALVTCLDHPLAAARTYLVSDGEDVSAAELVRRLGRALNRTPRLVSVPVGLVRALAGLAGRSADVQRLLSPLQVDARRIREELGWAPPFTLDQGIAETARWYRSAGK